MKKILFILIFFQLAIGAFAQKPPVKWKEVAMEDLQMTSYPLDTAASAVVLYDYGQYYFDLNPNGRNLFLFNKRLIRIKILKKEGLKYAKMSIPFIDMTCEKLPSENSIVIKGMTYNLLANGEIKTTRLKRKNIQYIDTINCQRIAEFELKDVKVGSVIDFYYEKPTLDFAQPKSWYFQKEIPVRHSELRMQVPRYFQYMFSPVNFENFDIVEETNYSRTLLFTTRLRYYRYVRTFNFDMSGKQLQFVRVNNEALPNANFIYNPERHIQKLNIHLVKATNEHLGYAWQYITHRLFTTTVEGYENYDPIQKSSILYPAGYILYNMHDWENVVEKLLKSDRFGLPLIKHWEYQPHLDSIIKGKTTDYEKMLAIYDYIRKNIKWNGEYDIYVRSVFSPGLSKLYTRVTKKLIKEKSLKRPFEAKEGTSSEINFILISLLNKAQIEAHPVLISTRDNEQLDINIPDPKQFNHVLALAKIGDEEFLLDATDSLRSFKILGKNHLTKAAFLVKRDEFSWLETNNIEKTSTQIDEEITIDNSFNIKQGYTIKSTGYDALELRRKIKNGGLESAKDKLQQTAELQNIKKVRNLNNEQLPLIFEAEKNRQLQGNELVITPRFKPKFSREDFTEYIRMYPVEFDFPYENSYNLAINLPEGFTCELPESDNYSTFGSHASFSYQTKKDGNRVELHITVKIKLISFPNSEYANLEQLFTQLNEKLEEKIIIKRSFTD
jgi:hypothetical protein